MTWLLSGVSSILNLSFLISAWLNLNFQPTLVIAPTLESLSALRNFTSVIYFSIFTAWCCSEFRRITVALMRPRMSARYPLVLSVTILRCQMKSAWALSVDLAGFWIVILFAIGSSSLESCSSNSERKHRVHVDWVKFKLGCVSVSLSAWTWYATGVVGLTIVPRFLFAFLDCCSWEVLIFIVLNHIALP